MSLWEHFDHLELNPLKDMVGRTPPLHAHLLHPDLRTGPRTQPETHTDETRWGPQRCALDTQGLSGHTPVESILKLELDSCELPQGHVKAPNCWTISFQYLI